VRALAGVASPPWWATALGLVGLWCGFAGSIVYAGRSGGLETKTGLWRLRPSDALWLGVGVLAQVVIDGTYSFFNVQHLSGPENTLFGGSHGASFALMGILTIFGSPVIEEWLFRGVIFRSLSLGLNKSAPLLAALVSALLFAAAHGEAKQFAGLFALGLLLAFVFYKTQRLTASIAVHAGFNALAYGSLLLQRAHG
jgi:membrane protease YdiL (CAAX protease family)